MLFVFCVCSIANLPSQTCLQNFQYLVVDEELMTCGDFYAKAKTHRVTRDSDTSLAEAQYLIRSRLRSSPRYSRCTLPSCA